MLCYTWPQTTIFIILHTYLIPYSFLEFGVPLKAVYRQLICLQASEQSFVQTQCLTHWVSHSGKHCVTQRERCPPFPHSLSTQWRTDATGWQMRCSTSLTWWESSFPYYVGSSLGAGFEMTEYEWPCASPFNSSLICSKKRGWTLRCEEKLRAQSLTFQLWQWKKGRFVFLSLLPTKGIDFSIFNSAKKWAFNRTQVKTDHTWYYKDCQDQIKSPTLSECLKCSLINSDRLNIFSRITTFVPLGHSQILGWACKLGYGTAVLIASS